MTGRGALVSSCVKEKGSRYGWREGEENNITCVYGYSNLSSNISRSNKSCSGWVHSINDGGLGGHKHICLVCYQR